MLSLDPNDLIKEVTKAEEYRRKHTARTRSIVNRFLGNWYRTDYVSDPTPENTVFAYVAFMLPELWYANPSCRVTAKRVIQYKDVADAMEMALRTWLSETDFTDEGQDVVRDALMGYGVMQVGVEPRDFVGERRQASDALKPFSARLSPEQLVMDPKCESPLGARFLGHSYWMDLDQLQADPQMWDPEEVAKLESTSVDTELDKYERALRPGSTPDRHRVNLVDLWIPEQNKLVTLARMGETTNIVLRSVDYWGPPEGPYEVYGFYRVPGDPYPMSPLQPIMEQLEELWAHQAQASDEARSFKRFLLVEAANIEGQKAVMNAQSGEVHTVKGLTNNFLEVEMGGSPTGRLEHIMTLRERADRTIGMSDAQRGRVQGKTATETDIVQGNVDTRTSYMRQRVQRHTERVLRRVAWYMFFDPAVVMPVTQTDPMSGTTSEGTFLGGPQPGQEDIDWVDFNLSIDPQSMQHSDDAQIQARASELIQLMQGLAPAIQQVPWVNWRYLINMFGESFNQKELSKILINQAAMQQFGQVDAAFGMGGPQQLPPGADPGFQQAAMTGQLPGRPGMQWGQLPMLGGPAIGGPAGGMPGGLNGTPGGIPGGGINPITGAPQGAAFAPRSGSIAPPMGVFGGGPPPQMARPAGAPFQPMARGAMGAPPGMAPGMPRPMPPGPRAMQGATPAGRAPLPPSALLGAGRSQPRPMPPGPRTPMVQIPGRAPQQVPSRPVPPLLAGRSQPMPAHAPMRAASKLPPGPRTPVRGAPPMAARPSAAKPLPPEPRTPTKQAAGPKIARPSGVRPMPPGPRAKMPPK